MQTHISQLVTFALTRLQEKGELNDLKDINIQVNRSKDKAHGDFACNIAMQLAKKIGIAPRELAKKIASHLPDDRNIDKVEVAGPGFLNFYLHESQQSGVLDTVLCETENFGKSTENASKSIHMEFVSANPTGPLHVGHGRGAAYGASIANILKAVGFEVYCEYYVNDAGRQIDILTVSVWLRYLELCGETLTFPTNAYQGDYIWDIAASIHREHENKFHSAVQAWASELPKDEPLGGDKELYIDAIITKAKQLLNKDYEIFAHRALETIANDIKDDLEKFGVHFNNWYSEQSLVDENKVELSLQELEKSGYTFNKDGALWFRSTAFGDEKDRVLIRENGQATYFASDIAYHLNKFQRGFDQLINIWGADHHGYIARVKAAMSALGKNPEKLQILLVQFANLYQGGKKLAMSTRSGEFVTLRQLRKQVGKDAARFFYVMRKCEQHLDFDLDLAISQTQDNPVYYVQYAHARICSIFAQAQEPMNINKLKQADNSLLSSEEEQNLVKLLVQFPEKVSLAAKQLAPHIIVNYLRELANALHSFYNANQVLIDDQELRNARLKLICATQIVIQNGLNLLDVSAPQKM